MLNDEYLKDSLVYGPINDGPYYLEPVDEMVVQRADAHYPGWRTTRINYLSKKPPKYRRRSDASQISITKWTEDDSHIELPPRPQQPQPRRSKDLNSSHISNFTGELIRGDASEEADPELGGAAASAEHDIEHVSRRADDLGLL